MLFPLLMVMSIVALVVIAGKQRRTDDKLKKIEKTLKYYMDGKETKTKKTEGDRGATSDDSGGH